MADAKRAPYMAKVSYNEFRKLHKGTPKKEMSELWKQYKNDEYELPVEEATTVEEQVEETVVEKNRRARRPNGSLRSTFQRRVQQRCSY